MVLFANTYYPSPASDSVTVPLIPPSVKQEALHQAHNIPSAGHQGYQKTLRPFER